MSRSTVIGFAVLVLAGLAALWFLVIRDPASTTTEPAAPTATAPTAPSSPTRTGPSLPSAPPTLTQATRPIERDMTGMVVTDHRIKDQDAGPTELPAEPVTIDRGRQLPSALVRSIHANASGLVLACGRKVAKADRGAKPKISAKLQVGIKDGNLHVLAVTPATSDLAGTEVEAVKTCVHDVVMGLEVPVPDEADLDTYDLELSYIVR